jgi:hypothetical protein
MSPVSVPVYVRVAVGGPVVMWLGGWIGVLLAVSAGAFDVGR